MPDLISSALLSDTGSYFFLVGIMITQIIYRIKYTVVMLGGEENPIGENGLLLLGVFYQRKEYLLKINLIFLSLCSTAGVDILY